MSFAAGEALEGLVEALESTEFKAASVPVYSNVEAKPVTDSDAIKDMLKRGLLSPVLWETIVRNMVADGIGRVVELGPGRVLQGLVKRIDRNLRCSGINKLQDIEQFN
ncbi:MAG: ACP S-malonyltransferase [Calditrichia bacterium]